MELGNNFIQLDYLNLKFDSFKIKAKNLALPMIYQQNRLTVLPESFQTLTPDIPLNAPDFPPPTKI